MKEAYVSFEVAKLLKEKGFDEPCIKHWDCDDYSLYSANDIPISNSELRDNEYNGVSAPTHQMACAWLRGKGIHIAVLYQCKFKSWERIIQSSTGVEWSIGGFSSHDEAIESALKYTLENLI